MRDWLESQVGQHERDLRGSDGRDGLLTRMSRTEDNVESLREESKVTRKMFWSIICLLVASLGGIVANLVKH